MGNINITPLSLFFQTKLPAVRQYLSANELIRKAYKRI